GAEAAVAQRLAWFGVLEGALQNAIASPCLTITKTDPWDLLSTSSLLKGGAILLRPADPKAGDKWFGHKQPTAQIHQALKNGFFLVVPEPSSGKAPSGWWEISADGSTRAVLGEDFHGTLTQIGPLKVPPPR